MADTTAPEAQQLRPFAPTWAAFRPTVDEIDADMHDAHHALQALVGLLVGADDTHSIKPHDLRALLLPIADHVAQAFEALALLQGEGQEGRLQ